MVHPCVSSCSRLHCFIACCVCLACGEVTTPGGQGPSAPRIPDPTTEEPPSRPTPDATRADAGADPDDDDDESCDSRAVAGLSVTIGSPDFACDDLRVTASGDDFEERLACSLRDERCRCFGVHERPGTYRVTVETGDPPVELAQSREIEVAQDEANCHVQTETLTLRVRAPDDLEDAGLGDAGEDDDDPGAPDAGD